MLREGLASIWEESIADRGMTVMSPADLREEYWKWPETREEMESEWKQTLQGFLGLNFL